MKKRLPVLLLTAAMLASACGCASIFEEEYSYEAPYSGELGNLPGDATEISNYNMLKTALTNLIRKHEEQGEFRFSDYNGRPSEDLAAACFEIRNINPLGSYAVDTLTYDTNRVISYYVADIAVTYKRSAEEIDSIQYVNSQQDFNERLFAAIDEFRPETVIRIFSSAVNRDYILRTIKQHYYDDPVTTVMEPAAQVESFPGEGDNQIYLVQLDYKLPPLRLTPMSIALNNKVKAAAAEMREQTAPELALEAAAYLSALCSDSSGVAAYTDTAYGALVNKHADSKGFALAYRALCGALDIGCQVVEGGIGTMGVEPHFWNIIELNGAYYHVDVSAFAENPAKAFLLDDDALWGIYIWEIDDYPSCTGNLSYAAVARPIEATEEPQPGEVPTVVPESPTPPAETALPTELPQESPAKKEENIA